jgi:predicted transcriptional regulator
MTDIALTAAKVGLVDPIKADVETLIAVEAITKGQAVYMTTAGKAGVADANASGKQQAIGIALGAAAAGQAVDICVQGKIYGFTLTSQNHGIPVYLSDTAGALADAAGTLTVPVGRVWALTDKDLTKVLRIDCRLREAYS